MFTAAQYAALSAIQKQAVRAVLSHLRSEETVNLIDSFDDDAFNDTLGLTGSCEGCVPSDYADGEDLDRNIIVKFKSIYGAGLDLAQESLTYHKGLRKAFCYAEPNVYDCSHVVIHDGDKVYYSIDQKAWALGFDNLEDLADEVIAISGFIAEAATR